MTVAEDPKNPAVLYAGTEFGLFVSTDRGGSWNRDPLGSADGADSRDRVPPARQRHDSRHARAQHLDPRRRDADPAGGGGDEDATRSCSTCDRRCNSIPPTIAASSPTSRSAARTRPSAPPISYYLKGRREERRASHSRRLGQPGSRDHGQRSARRAQRRHQSRVSGICDTSRWSTRRTSGAPAGWRRRWRWRRRFGGGGNNGPFVLPG